MFWPPILRTVSQLTCIVLIHIDIDAVALRDRLTIYRFCLLFCEEKRNWMNERGRYRFELARLCLRYNYDDLHPIKIQEGIAGCIGDFMKDFSCYSYLSKYAV